MNYTNSQSYHTLTHWQSGKPRGVYDPGAIVINAVYTSDGKTALVAPRIDAPDASSSYQGQYGWTQDINAFTPDDSIRLTGPGATYDAYIQQFKDIECQPVAKGWMESTGEIYITLEPHKYQRKLPRDFQSTIHIGKDYNGPVAYPVIDRYLLIIAKDIADDDRPDYLPVPAKTGEYKEEKSGDNIFGGDATGIGAINTVLSAWNSFIVGSPSIPGITLTASPFLTPITVLCGGRYDSSRNFMACSRGLSGGDAPGGISTGGNIETWRRRSGVTVGAGLVQTDGAWEYAPRWYEMYNTATQGITALNSKKTLYLYHFIRIKEIKILDDFQFFA